MKKTVDEDIRVTRIDIVNPERRSVDGKAVGRYITMEVDGITEEKEGYFSKSRPRSFRRAFDYDPASV